MKEDRDRARSSIDRIKPSQIDPAALSPEAITKFGHLMAENITNGEIPFRKAYLRSIIDRIEVDRHLIKIIGNTKDIENLAGGGTAKGVRSSVRKWRALRESNPSSQNENLVS